MTDPSVNHLSSLDLAPEAEALLLAARVSMTPEAATRLHALYNGSVDPHRLLVLAVHHRLLPVLGNSLDAAGLWRLLPAGWGALTYAASVGVRRHNDVSERSIAPVLDELHASGVRCVALKGLALRRLLYGNAAPRYSADADILVPAADLDEVQTIVRRHGFRQGTVRSGTFVPATREATVFHRMSSHEVFPYMLATGLDDVPFTILDIQFDVFSGARRARRPFPLELLWDAAVPMTLTDDGDGRCYRLSTDMCLLQLASHLYHDACLMDGVLAGKDTRIDKYLDVRELVLQRGHEIDWTGFGARLVEWGVNDVVYFAVYHAELLFGPVVPADFRATITPGDLSYLDRYAIEEAEPRTWQRPFLERAFDLHLEAEIDEAALASMPESAKFRRHQDAVEPSFRSPLR